MNEQIPKAARMPDEDGSFEADLRKNNPKEGERLDALLRGEIPH
jgi:hypothetical protein